MPSPEPINPLDRRRRKATRFLAFQIVFTIAIAVATFLRPFDPKRLLVLGCLVALTAFYGWHVSTLSQPAVRDGDA